VLEILVEPGLVRPIEQRGWVVLFACLESSRARGRPQRSTESNAPIRSSVATPAHACPAT